MSKDKTSKPVETIARPAETGKIVENSFDGSKNNFKSQKPNQSSQSNNEKDK